jgi:hypothetical protein
MYRTNGTSIPLQTLKRVLITVPASANDGSSSDMDLTTGRTDGNVPFYRI